jgi:hypothetical protein
MSAKGFTARDNVRLLGYLALAAAAAFTVLFVANLRARFRFGAPNFSFLAYLAAYSAIAGYGAVRLRRWGAAMVAVPLCSYGLA